MTFGSLFAGIGGIDLGLERAGMKCVWQVEIDAYCRKVLEKHWPSVRRWGDVRTFCASGVMWHSHPRPDLIAGGFPCQPVSVNGNRKGQADERWLWPEFARVVRVVRPRYVLVENVPGLLAIGIGEVLRDLAEIGFDAEWQTIPAGAFGAPHKRERVFIIAYPKGERCEGYFAPSRTSTVESFGEWADSPIQPKRKIEGWVDWLGRIGEDQNGAVSSGFFRRVDDGVPTDLDAYRAYGNSVSPRVAEWIGRRIMQVANF